MHSMTQRLQRIRRLLDERAFANRVFTESHHPRWKRARLAVPPWLRDLAVQTGQAWGVLGVVDEAQVAAVPGVLRGTGHQTIVLR